MKNHLFYFIYYKLEVSFIFITIELDLNYFLVLFFIQIQKSNFEVSKFRSFISSDDDFPTWIFDFGNFGIFVNTWGAITKINFAPCSSALQNNFENTHFKWQNSGKKRNWVFNYEKEGKLILILSIHIHKVNHCWLNYMIIF